jgi:hypothetical protein
MSLLSFLKNLPHKITKNELAKSCELILDSLRETTLPAYRSAVDLFRVTKPKSAESNKLLDEIKRHVKGVQSGSVFELIEHCLKNAETYLQAISKKSETLYGDAESTIALTYQKATYLRLVSSIGFAVEYSRRFLNYVYIQEMLAADPSYDTSHQLPPSEIEYINSFLSDFYVTLNALAKPYTNTEKDIDDMPDAVVTEMTEKTFGATQGTAKIDPLNFNQFILPGDASVRWNPFYLVGTMIASFQVAEFNTAKEELDLLQLRKIQLEQAHKGKPDPSLVRQIEVLNDRIGTLRYRKEQLEEKYGI